MDLHFIEASNGPHNWGKFAVGRPSSAEWQARSALPGWEGGRLIADRGWTPRHLWVMDLQTGEGAFFLPSPGAHALADLDKHAIWRCVLFPAFLAWLYKQDLRDLTTLPGHIDLSDVPFDFAGARGSGPAWKPGQPDARTLYELVIRDGTVKVSSGAISDALDDLRQHRRKIIALPMDEERADELCARWRSSDTSQTLAVAQVHASLVRVQADGRHLRCVQVDDHVLTSWPGEAAELMHDAGYESRDRMPLALVPAHACELHELPFTLGDVEVLRRPDRVDVADLGTVAA